MANTTNRSDSASRRRAQERQRRDERLNSVSRQTKSRVRSRRGRRESNPWPFVIGILLMCAVVIGLFVFLSHQQQQQQAAQQAAQQAQNKTTGNDALSQLASLDPSLFSAVGKGSASASSIKALPANANVTAGPSGKPQLLYVGAEYCPYCAGQRWGLIAALDRFGSFKGVNTLTSGEDSLPTFTFKGSSYTSQYIDFTPLEIADNQGNQLEKPTDQQQQWVTTYDSPPYTSDQNKGSIPFLLAQNKFMSSGAFYDVTMLSGKTYSSVVSDVKDSSTPLSKGIIGTANYVTAMVCQLTGNQPASVCKADPIPSLEGGMPKKASIGAAGPAYASIGGASDMVLRERE